MNHPTTDFPCDRLQFKNQCAIRLSEAFALSGIDTTSFDTLYPNRRCYPSLKHKPGHILAAQEFANWLRKNISDYGEAEILRENRRDALRNNQGILFIVDGWSSTDHIDLWNGTELRGGSDDYLDRGRELWFWRLP